MDLYQDLTFTYTLFGQEGTLVGNLIVNLGQSAAGGGGPMTPSTADPFAWVYQLDSTGRTQSTEERQDAIARAVDLLLASYGT